MYICRVEEAPREGVLQSQGAVRSNWERGNSRPYLRAWGERPAAAAFRVSLAVYAGCCPHHGMPVALVACRVAGSRNLRLVEAGQHLLRATSRSKCPATAGPGRTPSGMTKVPPLASSVDFASPRSFEIFTYGPGGEFRMMGNIASPGAELRRSMCRLFRAHTSLSQGRSY